jgi:hypothetical protein
MADQSKVDHLEIVRGWLADDGWSPELLNDGRTFSVLFAGTNSEIYVYVWLPDTIDVVVAYAACPFDIPADTIEAAKEFVARVNYGRMVGCMELSVEDGDVRFRSSLDFRGIELTQPLFRNVLLPAAYGMDHYIPALRRLVVEQKSALEVLGTGGT